MIQIHSMCVIDHLIWKQDNGILVGAGIAAAGLANPKTGAVPKDTAIKLTPGEWEHARRIRAELKLRWRTTFIEDCRPCDKSRLEGSTLVRFA